MRRQHSVLVIPGLGGHPAFHGDLIEGLRRRYRVITAPHADFGDRPCAAWEQHVGFWLEHLRRAGSLEDRPPSLVGISFGAHVAHAVRLAAAPGSIGRVTLVSYRHLTALDRGALRTALRTGVSHQVLGAALFGVSNRMTDDPDALRRLRAALYDSRRQTSRRLAARLRTLASAPQLRPPEHGGAFIFGAAERVLRGRHRRRGGRELVVAGGHGISIRHCPDLLAAVDATLQGGGQEERWS